MEPVLVLKGLLKARLRVEHAYYQMMDDMQGFSHHMGCWRGFMLCEGGQRTECKLLIRETRFLVDRFVVF